MYGEVCLSGMCAGIQGDGRYSCFSRASKASVRSQRDGRLWSSSQWSAGGHWAPGDRFSWCSATLRHLQSISSTHLFISVISEVRIRPDIQESRSVRCTNTHTVIALTFPPVVWLCKHSIVPGVFKSKSSYVWRWHPGNCDSVFFVFSTGVTAGERFDGTIKYEATVVYASIASWL